MWAMAGPAATRVLADYGATVVRIESETKIEVARGLQPLLDDEPGSDNSALFQNMNAGKLGLTLDLNRPEGKEIFLDLIRWADVLTQSFSPKAMRSWGLDYETLSEINPRLVMVSSCLMGQTGPMSQYAGFGTMGAAMSGFSNIVGWPDRGATGPFSAYTDYVAPRLTVCALMAALDHARRTGEGQHLDFAQAEASQTFIAPYLLDYVANGRILGPQGNSHPVDAPHAAYPAAGDDHWVALSCSTDQQWLALCDEMGRADLAADSGLASAAGRKTREEELNEIIGAWTADQDPVALQERLQRRGVAAHQVQNTAEAVADPQLQHLQQFREVEHTALGTVHVEGTRFHLSRTPAQITRGAPMMGEHIFDVLTDCLGYDADRVADLIAAEALV